MITTSVPPAVGPLTGDEPVIVGGGWYVKAETRVAAPPSGLVTLMATRPALPAGVRAVIAVVVSCCTVPAVAPKRTTAPVWKPVPVITTSVPPAVGPLTGDEPVIVGGGWYVKAETRVAAPPSGLVTLMATRPALPAGVRAVIAVVVSCCTTPAVAPKRTTAPVWNPVPVITTSVPPAVGPLTGDEPVIVGGGW